MVSTSLIEAGVDVDFPTVYRAYAGLDSEIQAGGRCNRENKRPLQDSVVYLFEPESKYKGSPAMKRPKEEALEAVRGKESIDVPDAVTEYFNLLYHDIGSALDVKEVVKGFEDGVRSHFSFPFKTAAENFHLIDSDTWTVLVPRDDRSREIAALFTQPAFHPDRRLYREMGQYCVNIYKNHFEELYPSLSMVGERFGILTVPELYDENTGLSFENDGGFGLIQ